MKILFVMETRVNAGSIQAAANYVRAAGQLGHTIAVYGCPETNCPTVRFSADVAAFDYVLFIVESKLEWMSGLRLPRIFAAVPWERRAVLDADGMYNRRISIEDYDRNHASDKQCERWRAALQRLGRKILQPTLTPLEPDVVPLPFYGYDAASVTSGETGPAKRFDIAHVGHNWWRWRQVDSQLLPAIERLRAQIGEICFMGLWWDSAPPWASELGLDSAFCGDADRFRRLRIQICPPVPYTEVIPAMSQAHVNIMTQRPLFRHLNILTSKYFEIFCADTIPLVMLEAGQAEAVYGRRAGELALNGNVAQRIWAALREPGCFREIVQDVRAHLAEHHSYRRRVEELVGALGA